MPFLNEETIKAYSVIGAGGISFLALIGILWYIMKTIKPSIKSLEMSIDTLKTSSNDTNNVLERVDRAIEESSKSNINVAKALELLDVRFSGINIALENQAKLLDKHDARSEEMQGEVMKISERTRSCRSMG